MLKIDSIKAMFNSNDFINSFEVNILGKRTQRNVEAFGIL